MKEGKLVRDKIPEIIIADGKNPITRILNNDEYLQDNNMVKRYNEIYRVQIPNITPLVCRHTYCSNMAKAGMNPKTLQYLMGHSLSLIHI